jgi:stage II sporulation protein M
VSILERRDHGKGGQPLLLPQLFLLATCFLAGVFLGQFIAGRLPETIGTELNAYLERYFQVSRESLQKAFFSVVLLYFRYPLMVVLLGFASVGVALIPGITVAVGFFLSYSVSCFVAAFGAHGAILAVAAMGFRCLFTIPCYFILAVPAWRRSAALTGLSFGRGRRGSLDVYGRSWWSLVILCLFVLLIGACLDLYCTPGLLKWAFNQTLF